MFLSLIIPCWGIAKYLPDLLTSLEEQTCRDFEVVFVDDGSTDGSLALLQEAIRAQEQRNQAGDPAQYRLLRQPNQGVGAARNNGLCAASGTYLLCVDGDDRLLPQAVEALSETLHKKDCDLLFFDFYTTTPDGKRLQKHELFPDQRPHQGEKSEADLFLLPVAPWNKVYRRDWLRSLPLRFSESLAYEDLSYYLEILARNPSWRYLPNALYEYRLRPSSAMHSGISLRHRDILLLLEQMPSLYQRLSVRDAYAVELEAAMVYHGYLSSITRLLRAGANRKQILPYQRFKNTNCPHYQKNPLLTARQKLLGRLYDWGLFGLARLLIGPEPGFSASHASTDKR